MWLNKPPIDPRFKSLLRIDHVLVNWPQIGDTLGGYGYAALADLGANSMKEIRRFLSEWIERMGAIYVAVSLTPAFRYPDDSATSKVLKEAVLPVCRQRNLPFAMMIGVQRQV